MIELRDVWKRFRDDWILRGVSISFGKGLHAIVGDNGSGKTTLIKIICGLLKPTRGIVRILGREINRDCKRNLGVLLHENVLYEELTVEENLRFYSRFYGFRELAEWAFEEFELERYRNVRVGELSFGWKRKANIVRALLGDPQILLLDEPFAGLDGKTRRTVEKIITEISEERLVVFTAPHEPEMDCEVLRIEGGHVGTPNQRP